MAPVYVFFSSPSNTAESFLSSVMYDEFVVYKDRLGPSEEAHYTGKLVLAKIDRGSCEWTVSW